jgi:hypothetical protein
MAIRKAMICPGRCALQFCLEYCNIFWNVAYTLCWSMIFCMPVHSFVCVHYFMITFVLLNEHAVSLLTHVVLL